MENLAKHRERLTNFNFVIKLRLYLNVTIKFPDLSKIMVGGHKSIPT